MKIASFILTGSLVANGALVTVLFLRSTGPRSAQSMSAGVATRPAAVSSRTPDDTALQAALLSGDSAALAAAGVPPEVIRALAIGRAFDKMRSRLIALQPQSVDDTKYWRRDSGVISEAMMRQQRAAANKAEHDFYNDMRAAMGEEDIESIFEGRAPHYAFLPATKREQLRQIEQDYDEMQSQAYQDQDGIQLPADQEKLRLLRLEKERDIAAALTPEQREQYELRVSRTANNVRGLYGNAIQNEEEYRKIFALQKTFDDQYNPDAQPMGPPSPDATRARREAEQKLQEDILASLNPDQLATLQRANDQDYKTLDSVARRLNLPANTTDVVLASREAYATQSMQINANPALTPAERRTQLQALATAAQNDLQGTLGVDGAQAYAQRSQWLGMLKNGNAFSTNIKDAAPGSRVIGSPIFQVQPPRAAAPPAGAASPKG